MNIFMCAILLREIANCRTSTLVLSLFTYLRRSPTEPAQSGVGKSTVSTLPVREVNIPNK